MSGRPEHGKRRTRAGRAVADRERDGLAGAGFERSGVPLICNIT